MLTYKDLQEVEALVRKVVKELISHLPSKDDFYTRMDALSKEIKDAREELEERVVAVEKKGSIHAINN